LTLAHSGINNPVMKKILAAFAFLLLVSVCPANDLPRPQGYLNDYAGIVDAQNARQIEASCASIQKSTGVEIAVVTVKSLEGASLEDEALRYLEGWGVGKKGEDNGIVVFVAEKERRVRIETGYGVEGVLPDGKAGEIIRYDIVPRFKQGAYGSGLLAAVYKIGRIVGGETVTYPTANRQKPNIGNLFYVVLFILFIIISIFSRRGGSRLGLLFFLTGMSMGSGRGGWGGSSGGFGGGFGGFGGGTGGGGGASGGW
jgi:uncharacterized protein